MRITARRVGADPAWDRRLSPIAMGTRAIAWQSHRQSSLQHRGKEAGPSEDAGGSETHMSQPPHSPADLGLEVGHPPTRRGPSWKVAAAALGINVPVPAAGNRAGQGTWSVGSPPRRLVDLLQVEPGHRIGFLDDPAGRGAQLAGELLGRQSRVFLYGVNVGTGLTVPTYRDGCFDLVVSAGDGRHWTRVSRVLADVHRLVRPGGTVAVITSPPLSVLSRSMRRFSPGVRPGASGSSGSYVSAAADRRDAHDIAIGKRLVEIFGSAVRTELGTRVVWHVTQGTDH